MIFQKSEEKYPVNREGAAHEVYVDVTYSDRLALAIDRLRGEEEACKTMCGKHEPLQVVRKDVPIKRACRHCTAKSEQQWKEVYCRKVQIHSILGDILMKF